MDPIIKSSSIREYFKDYTSELRRGESEAQRHNISDLIYDSTAKPAILDATVGSSKEDNSYSVQVLIDGKNDAILTADCSCSKENGKKCHHIAILCIYAYKNMVKDAYFEDYSDHEDDNIQKLRDLTNQIHF